MESKEMLQLSMTMLQPITSYPKLVAAYVNKAVTSQAIPPKEKHIRSLIVESHSEQKGKECVNCTYAELTKKLCTNDPVVCLKALVVLHRLFDSGSPRFLSSGVMQPDFIDQCANYWNGSNWNKGYGNIVTRYAKFLTIKMYLHEKFPGLPGDLSYDELNRTQPLKAMPKSRLVELSRFLDKVQSSQLEASDIDITITRSSGSSGGSDDLKASIFLPIVVESYNIYTLQTKILRQIAEEIPPEREEEFMKFASVYFTNFHKLKDMYEEVSGMKYVISIISVPSMPSFPPEFFSRKKEVPKEVPKEIPKEVPKEVPKPPQPQQPAVVTQPQQWATFETSFPAVNTQGNWATFETSFPPVSNTQPQKNPFVQPKVQQQQQPEEKKGTFSDLTALLGKVQPKPKASPSAGNLTSPRYVPPKVNPHILEIERLKKRIEELEKMIRELREENSNLRIQLKRMSEELASAKAALKREEENAASLQKALNDRNPLESAVKEMQKMVAQEKAASEELQKRYTSLSAETQKSKEIADELRRQLEEERRKNAELSATNNTLAKQVDTLTATMKRDQWSRASSQASQADQELEDALSAFNNPNSKGNPDATPEDVKKRLAELEAALASYLRAYGTNPADLDDAEAGARIAAIQKEIRNIYRGTAGLLLDSKGVAGGVPQDQYALRSSLLAAAGRVGEASRAAVHASAASQDGVPAAGEVPTLQKESAAAAHGLRDALDEMVRVCAALELQNAQLEVNIDDAAQRELLAAAAQIEALAAQLREARAKRQRDATLAPGEIDVDEAIMEAALAISQATSLLVNAAAAAQKERVDHGKAAASAAHKPYMANAVWAEGLISAGRAVAQSTQDLVGAANKAVIASKGPKDPNDMSEETLIASTHGVAASTAQLVAATRSKAEKGSMSQERVEDAAKAVSRATALLMEAAKAVAAARKQAEPKENYAGMGANAFRIKEMEQQVQIQRLEKELKAAREKLGEMRRSQYKK